MFSPFSKGCFSLRFQRFSFRKSQTRNGQWFLRNGCFVSAFWWHELTWATQSQPPGMSQRNQLSHRQLTYSREKTALTQVIFSIVIWEIFCAHNLSHCHFSISNNFSLVRGSWFHCLWCPPGGRWQLEVIFPPLLMDSNLLQESHNTLQAILKLDMKRIPFWPVDIRFSGF